MDTHRDSAFSAAQLHMYRWELFSERGHAESQRRLRPEKMSRPEAGSFKPREGPVLSGTMARKVERFSRDVPVGRKVLVGTVAKVDNGVVDCCHELLVPARALLYADLHLLCVAAFPLWRAAFIHGSSTSSAQGKTQVSVPAPASCSEARERSWLVCPVRLALMSRTASCDSRWVIRANA